MLEAISQGILLGLLLSILIGPVFFLLIHTSITKGFKSALYLNLGVFSSDLVCVIMAHFFASIIVAKIEGNVGVYLIGAFIFIAFGLYKMLNHSKEKALEEVKETTPHLLFLKGFLLNIINPSLVMFWVGASSWAISAFKADTTLLVTYFTSALTIVITVDLSKIYLAHSFKHSFTDKHKKYLSITTGSFLLILGLSLLYKFTISVI